MARWQDLPLPDGSYSDASRPWSQQDVVGYLTTPAEQSGARSRMKYTPAPGLKPYAVVGDGPHRGGRDVEGRAFVVSGRRLYQVTATGVAIPRGTIPGTGLVSMTHNQVAGGNQVVIGTLDNSYVYDTRTEALTATGVGLQSVDFIGQLIVGIEPQRRFGRYSSLADAMEWNTLDNVSAESSPDRIVGGIVSNNEWLIFGERTIEPWVNSPTATTAFQRNTGAIIERGCINAHTLKRLDNSVFFVDNNFIPCRLQGYTPVPIAPKPIIDALSQGDPRKVSAFTWEDRGYVVYYVKAQDGQTFGYDVTAGRWHRRESFGMDRWRISTLFKWNGEWYAGDEANGNLYKLEWGYVYEGAGVYSDGALVEPPSIMPRRIRSGVLHSVGNRVQVHALKVVANTGLPPSLPVPFPEQPEGPSISGEAPDGLSTDAYSFAYTTIAGDAPISRTVLRDTTLPDGWSWNESTATISHAGTPVPVATISLSMRVYDTNGLYADHDDVFRISLRVDLLVTGQAKTEGGPMFAAAVALEPLEFTGISQSTGATLSGATAAWNGQRWAAVTQEGARYADWSMTEWESGTVSSAGPVGSIVGRGNGWVAIRQNREVASVFTADEEPVAFTNQVELVSTLTTGADGDAQASSSLFTANNQFFLSRGKAARAIYRSDTPSGPYAALWDGAKELEAGRDLNGATIMDWFDLCEFDGAWYAIIQWDFRSEFRSRQIIRSTDLEDWTTFDVLADTSGNAAWVPAQLCANEQSIVAYTAGGLLWTSSNNWEEPIETGLTQTAGSGEGVALFGGRRIVEANGLFYCIGNTDTLVVFDPSDLSVSEPITLPIASTVSISAGAPT